MSELQAAYILHTRPFKDSSLIAECLTQQQGLISVVARGAKRPKSRLFSFMRPFLLLQLAWVGRTELKTLTQVEMEQSIIKLQGSKILLGLYLNELLIRLLQKQDPHPAIFQDYHQVISGLSLVADTAAEQILLRQFELKLLTALGYGIDLLHDAKTGHKIMPELLYRYEPSVGLVEAMAEQTAHAVSGASLMALAHGDFTSEAQLREAKKLIRFIFRHYLGEPLHSRKLFNRGELLTYVVD